MRNFIIGTGHHKGADYGRDPDGRPFPQIWMENTLKCAALDDDGQPVKIVCVAVGGASPGYNQDAQTVHLPNNLGHVGDLLNGTKKHEFCGWSASIMALAMIAYCNESDLIYKEADCLAFGDWVEELYKVDAKVVFGNSGLMACAQSLFLVKHEYIPMFVKSYLNLGPDGRVNHLPEDKFAALEKCYPEDWKRFKMGIDRERPDGWIDLPVFYVQHLTAGELAALKEKGLI